MVEKDALGQLNPVAATLLVSFRYAIDRRTYARVMMKVPRLSATIGTITQ